MIDFSNVKSIVIPEGEVSVIARGSEILWKKVSAICTLADFTSGFVNSSTGAVGHNATYPRAVSSPLISLEQGKIYKLNSDLSTSETNSGVRVRIFDASGSYAMSVTNANMNNAYMTMTDNASSIYIASEITMTPKQDCKIRIMFLDENYVTTAVFKELEGDA